MGIDIFMPRKARHKSHKRALLFLQNSRVYFQYPAGSMRYLFHTAFYKVTFYQNIYGGFQFGDAPVAALVRIMTIPKSEGVFAFSLDPAQDSARTVQGRVCAHQIKYGQGVGTQHVSHAQGGLHVCKAIGRSCGSTVA